jgi:hypothetical protein
MIACTGMTRFFFDRSATISFFFRHHFQQPMSKNGRGGGKFDMVSSWQVEKSDMPENTLQKTRSLLLVNFQPALALAR